jgi:hypothetical protein
VRERSAVPANPSIEDALALRDLTIDYGHHFDMGDVPGMLALFTDDGLWDATGLGLGRAVGKEELNAKLTELLAGRDRAVNLVANHLLDEVQTDRARGRCYFWSETLLDPMHVRHDAGWCDDHFRRVGGASSGEELWLFESRTWHPLIPPRVQRLVAPLSS